MRGRAGSQIAYWMVMKFCIVVGVPDIITHANFRGHRFRDFGDSGGLIFPISINLTLSSLKHSGSAVPACDEFCCRI